MSALELDALVRDARALADDAAVAGDAAVAEALDPRNGADPHADDALVARAILAGRARHAAWVARRRALSFGAVLAIAASISIAVYTWPSAAAPAGELVELSLPPGDRLYATGDARFEVASSEPALRRVVLTRGATLFDVAPLGAVLIGDRAGADRAGARFEVETPDARVSVVGTVFLVEVASGGTSVRVFEGRVEVEAGGRRRMLEAGDAYHAERATDRGARLVPLARAAAARRARSGGERRVAERSVAERSVAERSVAERSVAERSVAERSVAERSVAERSVPERSVPERSVAADSVPIERSIAADSVSIERSGSEPAATPREAPAREADLPSERTDARERANGRVPRETPGPVGETAALAALAEARGILRAHPEDALARALRERGTHPEWALLEADALRRLDRHREAADAYDRAARILAPALARSAGYLAAELRLRALGEAAGALSSLDAAGADDEGSPLRERALALRGDALLALGRRAELRRLADSYLDLYPDGARAPWMRARLMDTADHDRPSRPAEEAPR